MSRVISWLRRCVNFIVSRRDNDSRRRPIPRTRRQAPEDFLKQPQYPMEESFLLSRRPRHATGVTVIPAVGRNVGGEPASVND